MLRLKDFSVINFKKGKLGFKSALFLGPARFLNVGPSLPAFIRPLSWLTLISLPLLSPSILKHDCQSNCELRKISKQVIISTKRLIKKGEDLTVH